MTKSAARGHLGWARRTVTHPQVLAALAEGTVVSASMARVICGWTDKLPRACRADADEILLTAAPAGGQQEDIAALAAEIYARSLPEDRDDQLDIKQRTEARIAKARKEYDKLTGSAAVFGDIPASDMVRDVGKLEY